MSKVDTHAKTIDLIAIEAKWRPQSSERIKARFFECFSGAAEFIAEAAVLVKLLHERGELPPGLPMVGTLRRIAAGQIDPTLAWEFTESPNRRIVERLPMPDQKRIAANPVVEVAEGSTTRMVDLRQAPAEVAKIVVGPDGLRSPEEQRVYLGQQKTKAALKVARPTATVEKRDRRLAAMLTATEMAAFIENAAAAGLSDQEYHVQALRAGGAFARPKS